MTIGDLNLFYELLSVLEQASGQGRTLAECAGGPKWPSRGVYFFREAGEYRCACPEVPRVGRVGTHAVSTGSKSTLWGRLRTHRGSRSGGGNHRGSIFRLHVGFALLHRDDGVIGGLPTWSVGASAPKTVRVAEAEHERRVSAHLGRMSVLWVDVPDELGPENNRVFIERNAIALLSNRLRPLDPPSKFWLGRYSPRQEIRASGLWNINHVQQDYARDFLNVLKGCVERTISM